MVIKERMATSIPRKKRLKTEMVGFRAFVEDMAVVRSRAAEENVPWSQKLRLLIHDAVLRLQKPPRAE